MARAVFDITYSNFKNEVLIEQGAEREHLYHDVWNVMYNAEHKIDVARRKAEADRAWRREWEAKWATATGKNKGKGKGRKDQAPLPLFADVRDVPTSSTPVAFPVGYDAFPTLDDLDDLDVPPEFLDDGLVSSDERGIVQRVLRATGEALDLDLDSDPVTDLNEIHETAAAEEYIRSGGRRTRKKANGNRKKVPAKRKARPTDEE